MNIFKTALLALLLCWGVAASADVAVPALSGRVVDQTMTLTQQQREGLDQTLRDFETRKGSQVAVLIVPTTAPESIEQFSIRVAEQWKIGRKKIDDGAILVVAKNDRTLRIEVGYGLEGALTDVTAKRIIDEVIVPKFKSGDFAGGIVDGVDRILKVIDGEPLPAVRQQSSPNGFENIDPFNPFLLVLVFVLGTTMRSILGRLPGALVTGGAVAAMIWFVAGSLATSAIVGIIAFVITMIGDFVTSGGGRGGGFSGGSGGSWSSGSSGGGFSGGGGSFGGGGASGKW
ncbi:MAG TPA: YgcG family protein [Tardiphaga sp.]